MARPSKGRTEASIEFRVSEDERARIRQTAEIMGKTVSAWLRDVALDAAETVLAAAGSRNRHVRTKKR